ncbi:hypothetical protein BSZ39_02285 [Bowdeniella nasicola]|uniref:Methyltransferase domain-containing protein n=1 Tax=Bowdeniella nasicola TaxID=208480 RepID=A0A1Q5Q4K3_9ACTO|nr:class I SAM-dependent methyltransferase [Bowdeniella nasicola]OKL54736.1 hypothetical protein BSZ39_02285 [Bowdeniella nasicola]
MSDWDEKYRDAQVWVGDAATPLVSAVETFASDQVAARSPEAPVAIDIGAGEGRHARYLASLGYHVIAIEQSGVAIERAKNICEDQDIEWVHSTVEDYEPQSAADLIVLGYIQLPTNELGLILARAASWLAPGGHLVLVGHDISNLTEGVGGPQNPDVLHHLPNLLPYVADTSVVQAKVVERFQSETASGDATQERPALDTLLHVYRTDRPSRAGRSEDR